MARRPVTGTSSNQGLIWVLIGCVILVGVIGVTYLRPLRGGVAVVNGRLITKEMLYDEMHKRIGNESLSNLIDSTLIMQEAALKNLKLTDSELKAQVDRLIEEQYGSEENFESILSAYGLTRKEAEEEWRVYFSARKVILAELNIQDDEVEAYFEENKDDFGQQESISVRLMTLATSDEANAVLAELKAGGDFASIAKEKSIDTATSDMGGDMGWVVKGDLPEELESIAFAMEKDDLSEPIETEDGWVIIQVTDRKEDKPAVFEEVKDQVRLRYEDLKVEERLPAWLSELRAKAKIEYK
ncbi:MAG: peptidylprolyl isomerase [Bacillota bacterium]|jgi:foldase protein PrsA